MSWVRILVAVVLVTACGDNAEPLTLDEYADEYEAAWCRRERMCGLVPSVERCTAMFTTELHPDTIAAVEAGLVVFHPKAAYACVESTESRSCDPTETSYREPRCEGIFEGTLRDGEACAFGAECISRECWINDEQCGEACCRGECVGNTPPSAGTLGGRCRYSACSEGFCDGNTCVPFLDEGGKCWGTYECADGLSCSQGTCKRLPGAGEPCIRECREHGQRCSPITYRCERVLLPGEECTDNYDCSPHYACSTSGRCELQRATLGESCVGYFNQCEAPYVCDFDSWTCIEPKGDDETCDTSDQCASGSCSFSLGVCTSESCI